MSGECVIEQCGGEESIVLPKDHEGITWHVGDFMMLPVGKQRVARMQCAEDETTGELSWMIFGDTDGKGYDPGLCIHWDVPDMLEEMWDVLYEKDFTTAEELKGWIAEWSSALSEMIYGLDLA
jgi:hypothetical protein